MSRLDHFMEYLHWLNKWHLSGYKDTWAEAKMRFHYRKAKG